MACFVGLMESPLGRIRVSASGKGITEGHILRGTEEPGESCPSPVVQDCLDQLEEYFHGERTCFGVPLDLVGTPFRLSVWQELLRIPFGQTLSYGELARKIGNAKASRAVGGANHHNPVAIIVPCHRVIGADGSLVGYGGGLDKKVWLLEHERAILKRIGDVHGPDGLK